MGYFIFIIGSVIVSALVTYGIVLKQYKEGVCSNEDVEMVPIAIGMIAAIISMILSMAFSFGKVLALFQILFSIVFFVGCIAGVVFLINDGIMNDFGEISRAKDSIKDWLKK